MPKALTTPPGLQKKNKSQKKDPSNQLNLGPPHSRDLAIQDFTVVVVPGMRLNCLPRARRERAALRAHPSLWAASHCSAHALRGSGHAAELSAARPARACGAPRAPEFVGSVALLRSCATRERAGG